MAHVDYKDMRDYLGVLEENGLLKHVTAPVDLDYEIGGIAARGLDKGGDSLVGLLFENINGYPGKRVVANILAKTEQLALAIGAEPDDMTLYERIGEARQSPIAPVQVSEAVCQEEVIAGEDVNLHDLPIPWWHEGDAGRYIGTTAGVTTMDPETGYINQGLYRCMVLDDKTFSLQARGGHEIGENPTKTGYGGQSHILMNEAQGKPTPVALAIGMDPALTYAAGAFVHSDEIEHAEYAFAGALKGEPIEIVKYLNSDLLVPAYSEMIIEGEILPYERINEGPHGEHQGFYTAVDNVFVVHVKSISHRKDAIHYGLICRQQEDYPKFMYSAGMRTRLEEMGIADLLEDVWCPDSTGGGFGVFAIIAAKARTPADVARIKEAITNLKEERYLVRRPRWTIVVDDDCDVRDWAEVMWRVALGVMPDAHLSISERNNAIWHEPLEVEFDAGSCVFVDATFKTKRGFDRPINALSRDLKARVDGRWRELGLD